MEEAKEAEDRDLRSGEDLDECHKHAAHARMHAHMHTHTLTHTHTRSYTYLGKHSKIY